MLHTDSKQALILRRTLLGLLTYVLWICVSVYLYAVGLLRVDLPVLLLYFLLMLLTNGVFLVLIKGNWNLRFRDPGMTFVQMGCGVVWGMAAILLAHPAAHGGMLLVFATGFFFGVFGLRTRQFLLLTITASTLYGAIVWQQWPALELEMRRVAIAQWIYFSAMLLWFSFMGGYVARLRSNLRNAKRKIEQLAHLDDLTGADNRRAITGSLLSALEQAGGGGALSVCMLDLDHFKQVNDEHGHLIGDEVLRAFVARMQGQLRPTDVLDNELIDSLGRFGGEEFLVILPETNESQAAQVAERLRAATAATPFDSDSGPISVTVSIGVTGYRQGDSIDDLLRRADKALYASKQQGRNRVSIQTADPVSA